MAWALDAHPRFAAGPESRFLYQLFGNKPTMTRPYLYDTFMRARADGAWLTAKGVSYSDWLASLGGGVAQLFQSRAKGRRWVDSSPENALLRDDLLRLFPQAYVVGLTTSTRTAAFVAWKGAVRASEEYAALERANEAYRAALVQMQESAPDRVILIDERELLESPEQTCAAIVDFLGEAEDAEMAQVFKRRLHRLDLSHAAAKAVLGDFGRALASAGLLGQEVMA